MRFYTNATVFGNKILYRGVENNSRIQRKTDYFPTLYTPSKTSTNFQTIFGEPLGDIKPGSIKECREFMKLYEGVSGFPIYGMQRFEYAFISDTFSGQITFDTSLINVMNIDIEVGSENGFPDPTTALEPVTAITYTLGKEFVVLGCGEFVSSNPNVNYIRCNDEEDLLKKFLDQWCANYPDIITGWNVRFFDIPYLVNRIRRLFGDSSAKRLSPWMYLSERTIEIMGREQRTYVPSGIAVLDCLELYKKFAPAGKSQESYKLDSIANFELGEKKLSYEEYGSLQRLYVEDYQKFIEYNIRDVELVGKIIDKHKLIDLVIYLAYYFKVNYEDVFTQVRMWDVGIYNKLLQTGKIIPPQKKSSKKNQYIGAYVKAPKVGLHKYVVSLDLDSLYPHLIMQFNIGPDKFVDPSEYTEEMKEILRRGVSIEKMLNKEVDTSKLKSLGVTLTPNGQFFRVDNRGFLADMMENMYSARSIYKKKSIAAKKELEKTDDPCKRKELENEAAHYNTLQLAMKVSLNSAYGALGNQHFRFFDVRQASAITTSGQLAIQWIEKKLNEYLNKLLKTNNKDYVIASDTDSIYLTLEELINKTLPNETDVKKIIRFMDQVCEKKLQPFIDASYKELADYTNALDQKMRMKREALADRGIWTAKKRYVLNVHNLEGVEYEKAKIKVTGLEMIKSSTPSACKEKLTESLDILLNKGELDMQKFIREFREEFETLPINEIAFPRGMNGLEDYSEDSDERSSLFDEETTVLAKTGTPIHVRGSIAYNEFLRKNNLLKKYPTIKEGEKLKYIYLKKTNPFHSKVISFPFVIPNEMELHKYIDYDTQFEKSFLSPLKVLLNIVGWSDRKRNTLF